jgi:hypothetical protein
MMGEGWCCASVLWRCYGDVKGPWRLGTMVVVVHGCTVCTAVTAPGRHKDRTSDGSRFLMSSLNDYCRDNLHW